MADLFDELTTAAVADTPMDEYNAGLQDLQDYYQELRFKVKSGAAKRIFEMEAVTQHLVRCTL